MRRLLSHRIVAALWLALVGGALVTDGVAQTAPATAAADTGYTLAQPLTGRALPCVNGKIKIFDCQNVELLSYLPASAIGDAGLDDIWGWTDSATGREFVITGGPKGTAFVDVTDPVNPVYLGKLPLHGDTTGNGDPPPIAAAIPGIKVYQHHAFVVTELRASGMQVFDLTQLRNVKRPPAMFRETAHYDQFDAAHTLTMNEATGFAYPAGSFPFGTKETCGSGLHIIDVHTPTKPTFVGCYTDTEMGAPLPGYVHDAQCVLYHGPDARYRQREICLYSSGTALGIVDLTDKQQPKRLGVGTYPNIGYAHQGWFTEDQRYFFLDDEADDGAGGIDKTRTIVFDMSKLDDPVVVKEFYGTTNATDHNLYINGRYMYQSNYTAGLRIIDIVDPKNPKGVGYLDTDPASAGPGMKLGTWSNYPFLKEGVVAVASKGLFLVRLRPQ